MLDRCRRSLNSLAQASGRLPFALRLAPVLLLNCVLVLWKLGRADLWLDEGISYWIARKSLPDILAYSAHQIWEHPPGYYILLHFWMRLIGTSEFALRALSWLGGLLAVALIAMLARRWFGDRLALLAALVMATQPMLITHARDTRMYTLLMALALLNVWALDRALVRNGWRDWVLFCVTVSAMLGLHYLSGLMLLSYAIFLVICWRKLPLSRSRFALVLGGLLGLGLAWILLQRGPRSSALAAIEAVIHTPRSPVPLKLVFTQWALGGIADYLPLAGALLLAAFVWLLAAIGILSMKRMPRTARPWLPWLFVLLIVVPPFIAFLVLPFTTARHTSATFGLFVLALTLGVAPFRVRARPFGLALLLMLLGLNVVLSIRQIASGQRAFSVPMNYVSARARADEPLIYTYTFDWPLDAYYNRQPLPVGYLPDTDVQLTEADAAARAAAMLNDTSSLWLSLYPGLDNTDRVEQAFNRLAFAAERVWFPGDRGVVHYFSAQPLQEQAGGMTWGDRIALRRWWVSGDTVAAGDAVRLEFAWQRLDALRDPALTALTLVGPDGSVWAQRVAVPCNGRCETTAWDEDEVLDRQAFYVPPDVPPGAYQVRIAWLTPAGEPLLGRLAGAPAAQVDLPLMALRVEPPVQPAPAIPALSTVVGAPLRSGLVLRSVQMAEPVVRGGATLAIPLQLVISASQPELDLYLELERAGQRFAIGQPIGPAWHPSTAWQPGRTLRAQPQFRLPGTLTAGRYRAALRAVDPRAPGAGQAVPIGAVVVEDRPLRYDIPAQGVAVDGACAEGVRLVRFELPEAVEPGRTFPMTLTWQAGGPTGRNWKVYIHVLDAQGTQSDGYPADGFALTPSWRAGEVIVDAHQISLPAELAVGDYSVRLGFYDADTGERLACGDGDGLTLPAPLKVRER